MIKIIGPRDQRQPNTIDTTSHSSHDWSSGLSPFKLGPIQLYAGHVANLFENAWQFTKLYPEHADSNGQPTEAYWTWATNGWKSSKPHRYPMGKGRKPLCSLWNGHRLGYIDARKQIYLPLYQRAVKETSAYRILEETYHREGTVILFDFDGYQHAGLGMTLLDVLNCPTRICGHAFILAMMLTHGADFTIRDLESAYKNQETLSLDTPSCYHDYPINVVHQRRFSGPAEYIGRNMPGLTGSPLGNPFKVKPFGPYERDKSVLIHYRRWLWEQMQNKKGTVYLELLRLASLAQKGPLNLSCWCAPERCHGEVVRDAIKFINKQAAGIPKTGVQTPS